MKAFIVTALASFVILEACTGALFDEKQDALREIEAKLKDAENLKTKILTAIANERKTVVPAAEDELRKYLNNKMNETKFYLEVEASAVLRTAIVQGKPMSVVYCIRNITYTGNDRISALGKENLGAVERVKVEKVNKMDFDEYAVKAVIKGLTELVEQARTKIQTGTGGTVEEVKKNALSHCESSMLILGEIEILIHEPIVSREYSRMRQMIDRTFATLKNDLQKQLVACLNVKSFYASNILTK